jgi:alpha-L-rhamnosidase
VSRAAVPVRAPIRRGSTTGTVLAALLVASCSGGGHGGNSAPPQIGPHPVPARFGAPTALTVAGLRNPIGLAPSDISFAWQVGDTRPNAVQRGYRIVVTAAEGLGGVARWDSGEVLSPQQAFVPYGGSPLASDTTYRWTVQTFDTSNAASPPSTGTFDTGLQEADWKADWIRRPVNAVVEGPDQYTYVRKEVRLGPSPIVRACAYVSAGQQYELSINGVRAGKGEAYSYPDSQYYETLDVTGLLRAGAMNAFALLYYWDGPTKNHPGGAPGVIMQVSVEHADGTHQLIVTDGSWRVHRAAWLRSTQRDLEGDVIDYTEHIDGRRVPLGWDLPGFDDSTWADATVVGPAGTAPWTRLVSVRTRIVYEPIHPVSLKRLSSGAVVADFGKVYAAAPAVSFHHGVSGRVIKMLAGYLLDPGGVVAPFHGAQHTDMSYSYIERAGAQQFEAFDYLGFRYLQISTPGETLTANDVVALARHTALPDEPAATFQSSNSTLNAIFALGQHSALYSAQEEYIDTPTREKGGWLWDGFNESSTAMAAFDEQNLTRKSLLEFAASQSRYWPNGAVNKIYPTSLGAVDINEFTEIYPEWVWQYWMHTGDQQLLRTVYPALVHLAGYVEHSVDANTGLVTSLPSTSIYYSYPVVTRINVLGVNVFRRVADVATALHRPPAEIAQEMDRANELERAINAHLVRDGVYVDGINADGSQTKATGQEANACALAYGVVPANLVPSVARLIAEDGMSAPPRTAAELIEALASTGHVPDAVRILTNAHIDGWAWILAHGATYTWEVWHPSDLIGDSMSHGWGSNVLVELQRWLLGVQPTQPGYAAFRVAPPATSLVSAVSGTVPTPAGTISLSWERVRGGGTTVNLYVPPNTTAIVGSQQVGTGYHVIHVVTGGA